MLNASFRVEGDLLLIGTKKIPIYTCCCASVFEQWINCDSNLSITEFAVQLVILLHPLAGTSERGGSDGWKQHDRALSPRSRKKRSAFQGTEREAMRSLTACPEEGRLKPPKTMIAVGPEIRGSSRRLYSKRMLDSNPGVIPKLMLIR